jgi:hypothetical protein
VILTPELVTIGCVIIIAIISYVIADTLKKSIDTTSQLMEAIGFTYDPEEIWAYDPASGDWEQKRYINYNGYKFDENQIKKMSIPDEELEDKWR